MRKSLQLTLALSFLFACGAPAQTSHVQIASTSQPDVVATADPASPIVAIDSGRVRGRASGSQAAFRGIPYAAPPVGDLRWRSPSPPEKWSGVREATGYGYACMQSPSSYEPSGTPLGSEDCLTLNVFTPDLHPPTPLPVLVFIHGGFFAWGSSSKRIEGTDIFDGATLAKNLSAVVVTLNYRLGPLGFIAHPAFAHENRNGSEGNSGLEDQIAALRWVSRNIASFGGDRSHVTLSGHSAGAVSTFALMSSPLAKGLFSSAIAFSGTGYARPRKRAEAIGAQLAHSLACDTASDVARCMRSRSASDVIAAMPEIYSRGDGFAPSVDGYVLPELPIEMFRSKKAGPVPVLIGTTADEFSTMAQTILTKVPVDENDMRDNLTPRFGAANVDAILAQYPIASYSSAGDALIHVWSDAGIVCPVQALSRVIAAAEPGHVWRFVFAHHYDAPSLRTLGAGHGLELPLLFRNLAGKFTMNAAELDLANSFTAAVASFIRTGNPNAGDVSWPAFDAETRAYFELETPPSTVHDVRDTQCNFWDGQSKIK